jgi:lipopolysaccharide export system permease protein
MIGRLIDRCLIRQLLFASIVALIAFSAPVVLISLTMQLPSEATLTWLVWPALATIAPMIVYHTLPLLVPLAIVWCYANFAANGTLVTMHMAGLSYLSVRAPAITVAILAMAIAYAMSCWLAPRTAGNLQDVMTSLRHDMNPALLRIGQFNSIDGGRQVVFFRSRLNDSAVADVFIRERAGTAEERIFQAKQAIFARDLDEGKRGIILLDGTIQLFNGDKTSLRVTTFDRLVLPLTEFAYGRSTHSYTLVEELGPLAFLQGRAAAFRTAVEGRNWTREALKRFIVPALALIHTLFGLELLAAWGTMSGRQDDPVAIVCAMLGSLHFAVIFLAEQTSVALPWAAAVVAVAVTELAVAIVLMTVRSRRPRPVPGSIAARVPIAPTEGALGPVALTASNAIAQQVVKKMA